MPESLAGQLKRLWERGERPDPDAFLSDKSVANDDLFEVLLQDQRFRWGAGVGVPAEQYLVRWPELANNQDEVVDLIYAEFVLREQNGENLSSAEYENRFPNLADLLRKQFAVHRAMASTSPRPTSPAPPTTKLRASPAEIATAPCLKAYDLIELRGQGGMGQVFKGRQKTLDRIVAVKIIRSSNLENNQAVPRFLREGRAVARLTHPNVVAVHDAGCEDGVCFLVMEYLEGTDLHHLIAENGPLTPARGCVLLREAALGLHHAHERGLVHRDVKPANLFLTQPEECIKVLDFGLASLRAIHSEARVESTLTTVGQFVGTPDYAAPELIDTNGPVDRRADIYSLGCTAYYLLSGEPPFPGKNLLDKMIKQRSVDPGPLSSRGCRLPLGLEAVLHRMLAKDPADRFANCAAVAAALQPFCVATAPVVRRPWHSWSIASAAISMFGLVALLAFTVNRWQHPIAEMSNEKSDKPERSRSARLPDLRPLPPGQQSVLLERSDGGAAHSGGVESVAFFPDGSRAVSGGMDGVAREWDVAAGLEATSFPTRDGRLVAISADGKEIVTGGLGTIEVWNAAGQKKRDLYGDPSRLSCIALSPNARLLATADLEPVAAPLLLWNLEKDKDIFRVPDLTEPVYAVAFSPKGDRLVFAGGGFWIGDKWSGSDFAIRVWDVAQRKELGRLKGHTDTVSTLAFAAGGRFALSGGRDRSLRLWDVETGKELAQRADTHEDGLRCAAFTPNGRLAVTAGTDGRVKLWSLPTDGGEPHAGTITEVAGFPTDRHGNIVTSLAISPDGRFALSGSRDGTLRRWPISVEAPP